MPMSTIKGRSPRTTSSGVSPQRAHRFYRDGFRALLTTVLTFAFASGCFPSGAAARQVLIPEELETEYRAAQDTHQAAFQRLESLQSQFDRALEALSAAKLAGDEAQKRETYTTVMGLSSSLNNQQLRVEVTAEELTVARQNLIGGLLLSWDELLERGDSTQDPEEARAIRTDLDDTENRVEELRSEEPPVVTLEPAPSIEISLRDDSTAIRQKAEVLDLRADFREEHLAYNERLLEELRQEQSLVRRSQDFRADRERFGDTNLPVVPPGVRVDPRLDPAQRPMGADSLGIPWTELSYEERIAALLAFKERETAQIGQIRAKAAAFRRRAGGGWAWAV